eukprot:6141507-Amphidinium_carterae.1
MHCIAIQDVNIVPDFHITPGSLERVTEQGMLTTLAAIKKKQPAIPAEKPRPIKQGARSGIQYPASQITDDEVQSECCLAVSTASSSSLCWPLSPVVS